ncbi:MAG TPA: hypothetical protein VE975_03220 [Actinomycetota bacterium]|nr:hypothetical protein [Actinomycetota bacterium]
MTEPNPPEKDAVVVLRCETCGDVFPEHVSGIESCPSCGGTNLDVAGEPLL